MRPAAASATPPPPPPQRRRAAAAPQRPPAANARPHDGAPPSHSSSSDCGKAGRGGEAGGGCAAEGGRRPAVVLVHASYSSKEVLLPQMASYARRGYVAAALDNRYHGERDSASGLPLAGAQSGASPGGGSGGGGSVVVASGAGRGVAYQEAVVAAFRGSGERPFLLDTAWCVSQLEGQGRGPR
jgi:hypothetical protein